MKFSSVEFLRTKMASDLSNYHREYSPHGSYSLFPLEGSDLISIPNNEYGVQLYVLYVFMTDTFVL